jgi:cytochrome c biogenesis protein CcdA/glutaredoxin
MIRLQYCILVLCVFVAAATVTVFNCGVRAQPQAATKTEQCVRLQLYIRSDSKVCQEAQEYADTLGERRGGICIEVVDTLTDNEGRDRYWQLMRRFHVEKPRVPAFYVYDRLKVGFSNADNSAAVIEDLFAIHAYIRSTCQHCRDAKQFLTGFVQQWKGMRVTFHDIDREAGAKQEMYRLARQHGITAPSFPLIYVCGRVISGYHTDATTGRQIEDLLWKASVAVGKKEPIDRRSEQTENKPAFVQFSVNRKIAWLVADIGGQATVAYADDRNIGEKDVPIAVPEAGPPPGSQSSLPPLDEEESLAEQSYEVPMEAPEGVELPWVGYIRVRDLGLPAFTFLIGLIDGFNPCAMWVLVFLLSVLVNIKDRRRIAAIAGTFVVVSGLAYFAFMAAWLNLLMVVGIARPLQIALGVLAIVIGLVNVKDFFAFKKGVTLSIPDSAKPGIYARVRRIVTTDYISVAIGLSVVLAVVVNVVELMCTAGLPALYTQILTLQQLPAWKNYVYLGLYNIGYMLDDSLMVIAFVITLSHRKVREAEGRWLKLISGAVVLALGLAMLFRPDWLQW